MAAAALWGYPRAPCPLRIWGVYLMVGPSAMELTPSSWLFPDLLPLRVLESSKAANWYAPQQERVVVIEIVLVVSSSSRVATLLVSGVRRSVYSSS